MHLILEEGRLGRDEIVLETLLTRLEVEWAASVEGGMLVCCIWDVSGSLARRIV